MSRYIDADLIEYHDSFTNDGEYSRVAFGDDIDAIPTADVVEVVHGEWIDTETGECKCSHCKDIYEIKAKFLYSYCPNCGANMVKPITEMIDVFYANKHLYKKIGGKDEQIH